MVCVEIGGGKECVRGRPWGGLWGRFCVMHQCVSARIHVGWGRDRTLNTAPPCPARPVTLPSPPHPTLPSGRHRPSPLRAGLPGHPVQAQHGAGRRAGEEVEGWLVLGVVQVGWC